MLSVHNSFLSILERDALRHYRNVSSLKKGGGIGVES